MQDCRSRSASQWAKLEMKPSPRTAQNPTECSLILGRFLGNSSGLCVGAIKLDNISQRVLI
jgi:hypothetical protein